MNQDHIWLEVHQVLVQFSPDSSKMTLLVTKEPQSLHTIE